MEIENATYAYTTAFVDELARAGLRNVVICPGSRSTPLALTFAAQERIKVWVLVDERSAAFSALGMAKATHTPVALLCTSGTAAANFLPAIAEANLSRVPLVVLTADRPPELRDNGAPQAIDQNRLYGTHAKWFMEMALPEATNEGLRYARTIACRAVATAVTAPAGVIHLNFPFREPLTPAAIPGQPLPPAEQRDPIAWHGRADSGPFVVIGNQSPFTNIEHNHWDEMLRPVVGERGLVIVGPQDDAHLASIVGDLASALKIPVLADPLSRVRQSDPKNPHGALFIDSYDAFLRDESFVKTHAPQFVLRFGALPTSKPLLQYLQAHPTCQQVIIDTTGGWNEPTLTAEQYIYIDPYRQADALLKWFTETHTSVDAAWLETWQTANRVTRKTLETGMREFEQPFEGRVFSELATLLPDGSTLFVGNSMPIRDCDTFFGGKEKRVRVACNRGANGIDGVVSSALGAAAADPRSPLVLVIGDLSFYHDMNGLLAAKKYGLNATIIVINNDGGGIFSFLPQAAYPDSFELLYGTPTGLDFRHAAEMYGATFNRVTDWSAFRTAVNAGIGGTGLHIVELPTNRESNVTMHRQLWQKVSAALHDARLTQ